MVFIRRITYEKCNITNGKQLFQILFILANYIGGYHMIWYLIVGGILGWFASLITGKDVPGGVIGNIIAGIIGSWLGSLLLGKFGPVIGGFAIIPALIGAIILIFIVSFLLRAIRK